MPPRKYIFGCEKRKKKQKLENFIQSQSRALDKFFGSKKQIESSCLVDEDLVIEELNQYNENDNEDLGVEEPIECLNENENEDLVNEEPIESEDFNVEYGPLNINDPSNWDKIDQNFRDLLVERGPIRSNVVNFPRDDKDRHFSSTYYIQNLSNGEKQDRKWLVMKKGPISEGRLRPPKSQGRPWVQRSPMCSV
ncbi:hypothetical protein ACSBR2_033189 [Camellia fascicularis]